MTISHIISVPFELDEKCMLIYLRAILIALDVKTPVAVQANTPTKTIRFDIK
ncbi:hypothetical protein MH117_05215 [Paenibacillus sp. ACRRX]|uniref:hypothetical protein n=1 Tax=Paenibacillus sp. ACRRX TaxID=2918206 RepID=UPI001EF4CDF3|nr:hypothetical protein [Paenibacillus sp. ACRRX]MCG7406811.1 hypothetical protein [Paenibacillus sp. ACRRX]